MSQALRRNDTAYKFQEVTEKIEAALSEIPYYKLEISEEVREQVNLYHILEGGQQYHIQFHDGSNIFLLFLLLIIFDCCSFKFLAIFLAKRREHLMCHIFHNYFNPFQIELVHAQFKRAKAQTEFADIQLDMDMAMAQKEKDPDPAILKRLSEKLHLRTINDLRKESSELHEMLITSGGELGDSFEMITSLLSKLRDCVLTENPEVNTSESDKLTVKHRSPVIPDDFRCPISLELMKDPVIVSTGQVQSDTVFVQGTFLYCKLYHS